MLLNCFARRAPVRAAGFAILCHALVAVASAQTAQSAQSEADLLARGWSALARTDVQQAQAVAAKLRQTNGADRNAAILTFLVETGTRAGGPEAGLTAYEEWLGRRSTEVVHALRPVALAVLRGSLESQNRLAVVEAREGLAAEGDAAAAAALDSTLQAGDLGTAALGARRGNPAAVDRLIKDVQENPQVRTTTIEALGASGDPRAAASLVPLLQSDRDDLQVAAARALGSLKAKDAVPPLKMLLEDTRFHVRFAAAAALFELGDASGEALLQGAAASPHATIRAGAAEALASRPDAAWMNLVRELAKDKDPMVRSTAAQLLAPHDPAAATDVLQALMADPNPAIRELAGRTASRELPPDPRTLRGLLRNPDVLVRVRAANKILALIR